MEERKKWGPPRVCFWTNTFFYFFLNDLELKISSDVAKLVDDSKLFSVMQIKGDCEELQKDLQIGWMGNQMAMFFSMFAGICADRALTLPEQTQNRILP